MIYLIMYDFMAVFRVAFTSFAVCMLISPICLHVQYKTKHSVCGISYPNINFVTFQCGKIHIFIILPSGDTWSTFADLNMFMLKQTLRNHTERPDMFKYSTLLFQRWPCTVRKTCKECWRKRLWNGGQEEN